MAIDPMQHNALLRSYRNAGDDAHEPAVPAGFRAPAARREDRPREGAAEEAGYQGALYVDVDSILAPVVLRLMEGGEGYLYSLVCHLTCHRAE